MSQKERPNEEIEKKTNKKDVELIDSIDKKTEREEETGILEGNCAIIISECTWSTYLVAKTISDFV